MRNFRFFLIVLLFATSNAFGQLVKVSGVIIDTQRHLPIYNATVSAIKAKDSVLVAFTRTKKDGSFSMQVPDSTFYNLLIAHPTYASYQDEVDVKNKSIDKGNVGMVNRTQMLQTIVVRQRGSMRIKGDTTIYLADSFKVDDNASVEDLLKVLPGMQVDKEGNIITQGEQVQKVLVDGEEFFGDDPTVATKNLQAKTIDKVEVFDNKSEQAKFTGFDDGQREKTINLKMKANMNKGMFGKVQAASNLDQIWDNSAMLSSFKNKRKMSVYAINSSRGTSGLNWSDRERFGGSGGNNMTMEDGMMFSFNSNDGDEGMSFNGDGLPKANNLGVHYSNKWDENKHALNINGNLRENFINKIEDTKTTNYVGANTIGTNTNTNSYANRQNEKISTRYEWTIDTATSMVMYIDASNTKAINQSNTITENTRDFVQVSKSNRKFDNTSINKNFSADISFKKRLKKLGRTFSTNTNWSWKDAQQDGKLSGFNNYSSATDTLDQHKINDNKTLNGSIRTVYTEPLKGDKIFGEFSYALNYTNNQQDKNTLIKPFAIDDYSQRVDSLSNDFIANTIGNTVGFKLMYKAKKMMVNFGSNVKHTIFHQEDLIKLKNYDYNRLNFLPNMNLSYRITSQQNIRISYNGNTNQPSIFQLQNVQDNTDPLNISIGNPTLKQEYRQSFSVNYWNYKTLSDRSFNSSIWFTNTFNSISRTQQFEASTGRTINTYTNLNGNFSLGAWNNFSTRIGGSNFTLSANFKPNYSRSPNIVNGITSFGNSLDISTGSGLRYVKKKTLDASIDMNVSRNSYSNKIMNQPNTYYSLTPSADVDVYITKRCIFGTDADYVWRQKNAAFATDFSRLLWNASITYRFLTQKNLEAKIYAKDLLKQNTGNTRTASGNYITEKNNNSIQRYILLSLVYNFSVGPINKLPKSDDDE
ncbi:MAG: hypothetical protein RLZZ118_2161 [Bacteroidota bacterium]|jgi:hypothetical protein